eukprot:417057-Pelagomonas_calceolata.AAC.2
MMILGASRDDEIMRDVHSIHGQAHLTHAPPTPNSPHHGVHDVGPVVACDDDENGDEGVQHVVKVLAADVGFPNLHQEGQRR